MIGPNGAQPRNPLAIVVRAGFFFFGCNPRRRPVAAEKPQAWFTAGSRIEARERVREVAGVIRLINRDRSENPTPFDTTRLPGQYTWKMDQALPGKHTLRLYRSLTSDQAAILIQARTGHCRPNQYLSRIGAVDEATCSCGNDEETIRHLILSCPRWTDERRELSYARQ